VQLQVNNEPTVQSIESQSLPSRDSDLTTEPDPSTEETLPTSQGSNEIGPHRSTQIKHKSNWYGYVVSMAASDQEDPTSVTEARAAVDRDEWNKAMKAEM